jgi:hypothetical protein
MKQFQKLRLELRKSHASNQWHSNLVSAKKLKGLLNEAPDSLLEVARADVRVGDIDAALHVSRGIVWVLEWRNPEGTWQKLRFNCPDVSRSGYIA